MSSYEQNHAAYLLAPLAKTLTVQPAPYPSVGSHEVIIRTAAVAINPLEKNIQDYNPPVRGHPLRYPLLMGSDVAGTIVEIGLEVKDRSIGQRVILNAHGIATGQPANSGFQRFVLVGAVHTIPIPDTIAFKDAVVLPLACNTAAAGLFSDELLNLSLSNLNNDAPTTHHPGTILIWGGSSSVGCCAIQLAVAAGYRVFTTASTRNHALCLSLGAGKVFDHTDTDVEDQILAALKAHNSNVDGNDHKSELLGALDCIANKQKTIPVCARILAATINTNTPANDPGKTIEKNKKKLITALSPPEEELAPGVQALRLNIPPFIRSEKYGVVNNWIEKALGNEMLKCKPDARVVGRGLESVQIGIDILREGVSAEKLVVEM